VDHRVLGSTVFPGTAYLEMAARGFAATKGQDWRAVTLKEVTFERPLVLSYGKTQKVSLVLEDLPTNRAEEVTFSITPSAEEAGIPYCRGRIAFAGEDVERASMEATFGLRDTQLQIAPFYGELRKMGLEYGASFSTVRELWAGQPDSGDALGRISFSPNGEEEPPHPYVNSVLLDGCLQVFGAGLRTFTETTYGGAFVPASIQSITLRRTLPSHVWSQVNVRTNANGRAAVARIRILSDDGEVLTTIDGLELRQKSMLSAVGDDPETSARLVKPKETTSESRDQLLERLRPLPVDQRVDVLAKWLAGEVKDILGQTAEEIDLDEIDPSTGFVEIGLDSLLVTELQRRIQEKLEFRFEPMQGLDYQSIESLAEYILNEVLVVDPPALNTQTQAAGAEVA
jgi:acyl carrier protein